MVSRISVKNKNFNKIIVDQYLCFDKNSDHREYPYATFKGNNFIDKVIFDESYDDSDKYSKTSIIYYNNNN